MGKSMNSKRVADLFVRVVAALLIVLGLSVGAGIHLSMAAIDLAQQRQFDIAPQQLSSALLKFSAQSDIQVTVPGQLAEGKLSPGVVGRFNAGSALAILLKDTSLHYDVVDGSTVVITGPSERKAVRNDIQKINSPVIVGAPASSAQEIRVAQATSTTAQTTSAQSPSAVATTTSGEPNPSLTEIVVTGTSTRGLDAVSALPVTVLKAGPCIVVQRKTPASDGYDAVQLGFVEFVKPKRVNQPMTAHRMACEAERTSPAPGALDDRG